MTRRRLALVVKDRSSGSARVRLGQLVDRFEAAGVQVRVVDWQVRSRAELVRRSGSLLAAARWADVVVLQKPAQPPWLLDAMRRAGADLAVDVDDALWVGSAGAVTPGSRRAGERLLAAVDRSVLAVAGSRWLAAWLREAAPDARVEVIGSSVDVASLEAARRDAGGTAAGAPAVVGWIGSGGNLRDLHPDFVAGVRPLVEEGSVELVVICDRAPELEGLAVRHVPWRLDDEAVQLAALDVGVMPLRDDDRARGRCSYKAVQYLAAGVPVVASPVGGATEVVVDGRTGLAATTASEWEGALRRLLGDGALRRDLTEGGRALVRAAHDADVAARRWLELLDEVGW